ncbi:MAG: single-stranded-DNA-specific exonuclease RecJ [Clostridium sp.]|nr:single-stranded-DNA-specific exonuclease RecJ [Clostridium sp.]
MAEQIWMLQTKRADFDGIARQFGIDPVTARVIRNRGIEGRENIERYLYGDLDSLYSPWILKDMRPAVDILKRKLKEGQKIRIVGDYDIDGVCSTYILYQALKRLGGNVDYAIPDRIKDGYGINESMIRAAAEDGIDTILTCDNGISAFSQIQTAKEFGMTVIVTDHHEVPADGEREILPPADAVIDPKQRSCSYPFPEICGAVVAYKLVQALYEESGVSREEWLELLEFAAIATVGDVMKLQDENRMIVKYGLKKLGHTKNLGLKKLAEKTNLDLNSITAYHIGFVIGPCLNAGGRLQTAKLALSMLLAKDEETAEELAQELKDLNDMRKDMTEHWTAEAKVLADTQYRNDKVLVIFLPDCHESLAGIIAGRLREYCQKPAIVLTRSEEAVKGSGRSIESYHMFQKLSEVKDLMLKFGGHPMAAGLSLLEENIDEFRRELNERSGLTEEDFKAKLWIDVPMPIDYINERLVEELKILEPFGQGNEKPLFAQKQVRIRSCRVIGKNKNVVKLVLEGGSGMPMDGILFTDGIAFEEERAGRTVMDIIYYPEINEYNGNRNLQVVIRNYKFPFA